jgi:hypothetical protein
MNQMFAAACLQAIWSGYELLFRPVSPYFLSFIMNLFCLHTPTGRNHRVFVRTIVKPFMDIRFPVGWLGVRGAATLCVSLAK